MPTDRRTLLAVWALAEARRLKALAAEVPEPVGSARDWGK